PPPTSMPRGLSRPDATTTVEAAPADPETRLASSSAGTAAAASVRRGTFIVGAPPVTDRESGSPLADAAVQAIRGRVGRASLPLADSRCCHDPYSLPSVG